MDISGSQLVVDQTQSSLNIVGERLIPGASYDLSLKVSRDTRQTTSKITLNVLSENSVTRITINIPTGKVSPQSALFLQPNLETDPSAILKWSCLTPQLTISPDSMSVINIPPNTLKSDETYQFQLTITENSGVIYTINLPIKVNAGASCLNDISISPDQGTALITMFTISLENCVDLDDEDYPLKYLYENE